MEELRFEIDYVSIPSRGFWFFEGRIFERAVGAVEECKFQSPRGDFGFLKSSSRLSRTQSRVVGGFNPLAGILVF